MTARLKCLIFSILDLSWWGRLLFPIARMSLTPLPHSFHVLPAAEVITVGGSAQPAALTGLLAGRLAPRLGTINLMVAVAVIGQEKLLTTTALAAAVLGAHDGSNDGRKTSPCTQKEDPPKKTNGEEGRRVLSEDGEEDRDRTKRNFRPPAFLHIHFAAHIIRF
jgi:hypothetical protein